MGRALRRAWQWVVFLAGWGLLVVLCGLMWLWATVTRALLGWPDA